MELIESHRGRKCCTESLEAPVYPVKLRPKGMEHEIAGAEACERINTFTFDELVYGRFEEPALHARHQGGARRRM